MSARSYLVFPVRFLRAAVRDLYSRISANIHQRFPMSDKPIIATGGSTLAPALAALRASGYDVSRDLSGLLLAEGALGRFVAEDPVSLLGLIRMREIRGEAWKSNQEEVDALLTLAASRGA